MCALRCGIRVHLCANCKCGECGEKKTCTNALHHVNWKKETRETNKNGNIKYIRDTDGCTDAACQTTPNAPFSRF